MIKHIVMWKFRGGTEREVREALEQLRALSGVISEIEDAQIGVDIKIEETSYDAVLVSTFKNAQDLATYKIHPEHKKVSAKIAELRIDRKVVDFEF